MVILSFLFHWHSLVPIIIACFHPLKTMTVCIMKQSKMQVNFLSILSLVVLYFDYFLVISSLINYSIAIVVSTTTFSLASWQKTPLKVILYLPLILYYFLEFCIIIFVGKGKGIALLLSFSWCSCFCLFLWVHLLVIILKYSLFAYKLWGIFLNSL